MDPDNEPRRGGGRYEETRAAGRAILEEHLGPDALTVEGLVATAADVLGPDRTARCVEVVRRIRLTQRYQGLSALAALIVGTRELGETWWSRPHRSPIGEEGSLPVIPDDRLAGATAEAQRDWPSTVVDLGFWIADDVAVARWGPLVDYVDLNDSRPIDRIRRLAAGIEIGTRVTAQFDTGGVVDAVVEEREGGAVGTRLDLDSIRYSLPAEVDWAWAVALPPPGPFPLRGDDPDPYQLPIDDWVARELRTQAVGLGLDQGALGQRWENRGDLCSVLARLDWPWIEGPETRPWVKRVEALVDADRSRARPEAGG